MFLSHRHCSLGQEKNISRKRVMLILINNMLQTSFEFSNESDTRPQYSTVTKMRLTRSCLCQRHGNSARLSLPGTAEQGRERSHQYLNPPVQRFVLSVGGPAARDYRVRLQPRYRVSAQLDPRAAPVTIPRPVQTRPRPPRAKSPLRALKSPAFPTRCLKCHSRYYALILIHL